MKSADNLFDKHRPLRPKLFELIASKLIVRAVLQLNVKLKIFNQAISSEVTGTSNHPAFVHLVVFESHHIKF
jgi:hypothetical protein